VVDQTKGVATTLDVCGTTDHKIRADDLPDWAADDHRRSEVS